MSALGRARAVVRKARPLVRMGTVSGGTPFLLRCSGLGAALAEQVDVEWGPRGSVRGEVVALRGDSAIVLPLGDAGTVGPGARVRATGRRLSIAVGGGLLGRVLDGLGEPIDGRPLPRGLVRWEVDRAAPAPLERPRLHRPFTTGIRVIDGFAPLAEGQRVGLFAGPGAGKSSLLARLARGAGSDVCVVGLVGERGREVRELVEDALGTEGLRRSVVVAATSDAPAAVRVRSAQVATAVAEWFARVEGRSVLLLVDSLTRFARAVREVGLGAGEAPVRQGFPSRVFSELPRLVERAGTGPGGSITAVYTVLSAGGEADDPISAEIQGLLDGHLLLDRRIGEGGRHPAVDVLGSLSRCMGAVTDPEHRAAAARVRRAMARWEAARDLVAAGAWVPGADPALDAAAAAMPAIEAFLRQDEGTVATPRETRDALLRLADGIGE